MHTQKKQCNSFLIYRTLDVWHLAMDEEFLSSRSKQGGKKTRRERKNTKRTEEEKEVSCHLPDSKAIVTFFFCFFPPLELNHKTPEQQQWKSWQESRRNSGSGREDLCRTQMEEVVIIRSIATCRSEKFWYDFDMSVRKDQNSDFGLCMLKSDYRVISEYR